MTRRIGERQLSDLYGTGALPVDYPNEWDRRLGRTGYGIWLHGVPTDTYSRAPRASDGCLALPNADLERLWNSLDPELAPVIITRNIRWLPRATLEKRRSEFADAFESWRRDWESLNLKRYLRHYSTDFRSDGKDYHAWVVYKQNVNTAKRFITVAISGLSVLGYPGEKDLVVATFEQDYRSSNFASKRKKRQYWRRELDGQWRILYEGVRKLRPEQLRGIPYSARSGVASAQ